MSEETKDQDTRVDLKIDPDSQDFHSELSALKLLYVPFRVVSTTRPFVQGEQSLLCQLTLRPSDPDLPKMALGPDGLELQLCYKLYNSTHEKSEDYTKSFCRVSLVFPHHSISCTLRCVDPLLPKTFQHYLEDIFYQSLKKAPQRLRCVYFAMNQVDNAIASALELMKRQEPEAYEGYLSQYQHYVWTQNDQLRLEQALVLYRTIADARKKWKNISEFVSCKERYWSPRDCVSQFLKCREALECHTTSSSAALKTSQEPQVPIGSSLSSETPGEMMKRILLGSLCMKDILLMFVTVLRVKVICTRCSTSTVIRMKFPSSFYNNSQEYSNVLDAKGDEATPSLPLSKASKVTYAVSCMKCSWPMTLAALPQPVTESQCCLVEYTACGLFVQEVMPPDLVVECISCSSLLVLQNVMTGIQRTVRCSTCFSSGSFRYNFISLQDQTSLVTSSTSLKKQPLLKTKKKKVQQLGLKIDTPLPLNGACQHYKKSFRWLRFPCCNEAFPCDKCHDLATDHSSEWANRMICGYCSREQHYSNKPCVCGHAPRMGRSAHWEGGKGCRDRQKMNRKDSKKYKRGPTK